MITKFSGFLNENNDNVIVLTKENIILLFNGEVVTVDGNDIKLSDYDLIQLAQGVIVKTKNGSNVKADEISFKELFDIVKKSKLNEYGALFSLFIETHPSKTNIL